MAAADYWPQEEGYIVEGATVVQCVTAGTITEMACVKISGTTAGQITVDHSAAWGDAIGVALRACTVTGQMIPVAFDGVVKLLADATLAAQQLVCSAGSDTSKIIDAPTSVNLMLGDNGTAWVLGVSLQAAADDEDQILVLLGRGAA